MTLSGQRMRTPIRHGFCIVPAGDAGMENIIVGSGKPAGRTRRMIEVATMKCCCRAFFLIVVLVTVGCEAKRPPQASRPAPTTGSDSVKPVAATDTTPSPAKPLTDKPLTAKPLTGPELYARHCGACHGASGDGQGIAATFLYPKPRNLRTGSFRLISTISGVPSPADIEAVLVRGMPGSAMPPWAHLTPDDRRLLVEEVLRLRREGIAEDFVKQLKEQGEEQVDEQELKQFVESKTTPGPVLEVPKIGPPDAAAIARGKELFVKQSCNSCHGNEGRGDGQQKMVDSDGFPTRPRDLTRGIYKGGPDPESFYRRISLGMPGTPMPASTNLKPAEIVDLLTFLRSLSTDAQREAAVSRRDKIVVPYATALPESATAPQWADAAPAALRLTPLWWRDDFDPALTVQALHDGRTVALKLSWGDKTLDENAGRTQAFRDAVAVELFRGGAEPFLGMGAADAPVDIWFWQAEPASGPPTLEQIYPRTTVDIYPLSEKSVATAEFDRPGTRRENQPPVSLTAEASGNPVVPVANRPSGSSLAAGGPGSVTFRMPKSRLVKAQGQWQDGRWTVVLTRPLSVATDAGVPLAPGERASIALAVWDGAHRDRNGQKSVTIWQDLILETPPAARK